MDDISNKNLSTQSGGGAFSAMLAIYILLLLFAPVVLQNFLSDQSKQFYWVTLSFSAVAMLLVAFAVKIKNKIPFASVVKAQKFNPVWLVVALLVSVGMFMGLGFVNDAFATLLQNAGFNVPNTQIQVSTPSDYIVYVIILAVLPAVCEEFFFRGVILNALEGCKKASVLVTGGLAFALYHCSAVQLVYQFIYGVILTAIALKAKSCLPCVVAHFINNFAVLTFIYFNVQINLFNSVIIAVGLVALALALILIVCISGNGENNTPTKKTIGFYLPYGVLGVAVCISLIIGGLFV